MVFSLTPARCWGERPEIFYLTIAVPVIFWMTCAEILELASRHERMPVPLDLEYFKEPSLRRAAACRRRPLQPQFLSGVYSWV